MPTYGNLYPELLSRWQQLNLNTSKAYIQLLLDFFEPIEIDLRNKIVQQQDELFGLYGDGPTEIYMQDTIDKVIRYENKLLDYKKKKLLRDMEDFSKQNVFTWSRFSNREGELTSNNNQQQRKREVRQYAEGTTNNTDGEVITNQGEITLPEASEETRSIITERL